MFKVHFVSLTLRGQDFDLTGERTVEMLDLYFLLLKGNHPHGVRHWSQTTWVLIPPLPLTSCMCELLNFAVPRFSPLPNRDNNNTFLTGLLKRFNFFFGGAACGDLSSPTRD